MKENLALGFLFERTTRVIKLRFHQLFKEFGYNITPEQWIVLDILHDHGTLSQKEIARLSFKDAPSISRILEGLYKKKYIKKVTNTTDKRSSDISLTDLGQKIIDHLLPEVKKLRAIGVEGITLTEIEELKSKMNQIFSNYDSY